MGKDKTLFPVSYDYRIHLVVVVQIFGYVVCVSHMWKRVVRLKTRILVACRDFHSFILVHVDKRNRDKLICNSLALGH